MVPDLRAPQAYSLRFVSVCREQPGRLLPLLGRSVGYSRAVRVWDFPPPDCEQRGIGLGSSPDPELRGNVHLPPCLFPSSCSSCVRATSVRRNEACGLRLSFRPPPWTPPYASKDDDWGVITQVVVPSKFRSEVLRLAKPSHPTLSFTSYTSCWVPL
uniref:Uncharacterized protein n=1 Tax=Knipowitschia caucasica TaxID=637954 RepID=A0AAV2ITS6_KNICA